jgi:hypothetical protein
MDYGVPLPIKFSDKKTLPVKKEFEYDSRRSFTTGNPYTMAFCYPHPLYHKPFIVKGGYRDCDEYLSDLDFPVFVHVVFFYKGTTRRIFKFYNIDERMMLLEERPSFLPGGRKKKKKRKWKLYLRGKVGEISEDLAIFKRVPRRWIRELNLYVKTERRRFHDV